MSAFPTVLFAQTGSTLALWFAVLGGAAGFVSLYLTLKRSRALPPAAPVPLPSAPAPMPVAPAAPAVVAAAPVAAARVNPPAPVPAVDDGIPADVMALIAAAVAVTVGPNARVAAVHPTALPLDLLQQWSVEGRRQIYSSHQIR